MAHLIDFTKGKAAFTRRTGSEPAWHELGGETPAGAPLEIWAKNAGLDFEYAKAPVFYQPTVNGVLLPPKVHDDRFSLYRNDTGKALAVVSDRYQIVQPAHVLEFFRDLIDTMGYTMETAGSLMDGRRIWALAKTGQVARIMGNDPVGAYLLLVTSCDTQLATQAQFTSVRVVCNNTLQVAVNNDGSSAVRVPHSTEFDAKKVKEELGILDGAWAQFETNATALAKRKLTDQEVLEFLVDLMGDNTKPLNEQPNQRGLKKVVQLYKGGAVGGDLQSTKNSAWGLMNAVTEYADFHAQARSKSSRLNSAWLGNGAKLKQDAWHGLLKMAA